MLHKKSGLILSIIIILSTNCLSQTKINNLLTENLIDPMSVASLNPRFTWQLESKEKNILQTAYEIKVADEKNIFWNSGKILSNTSVHVTYNGSPLKAGRKYSWQVRVWDNKGKLSAFSAPAYFRMALLSPLNWKAQWIEPGYKEDSIMQPCPILKTNFQSLKKVVSAIAYITSHGLYEAQINGQKIGDSYLTPGWTSYNKRLQYQAYDVTSHLKRGENALQVMLGSGWYRGYIGWWGQNNFYGNKLALLFQLQINYSDGTKDTIISDGNWQSSTSPVLYSQNYNGEIIDARYTTKNLSSVKVVPYPLDNLVPTINEPVRIQKIFSPAKIFKSPNGDTVIDFGQNLAGVVQIKVNGNKGDSIKLEHAEVLDKKGNFYNTNLRAAKQTDIYILNGKGEEIFQPHFTIHGFRFVRIKGIRGQIHAEQLNALVLCSDMPVTGSFECSNPLLNKLQHNILWSMNSNFVDIPTDCPQRDERVGWTGDIQIFCRTAAFNRRVNNFLAKWLKDLKVEQFSNGAVPFVIPNILGDAAGAAGWSDAATIIPWNMYLIYDDRIILEEQYPSMKMWIDYMANNSENGLWNKGFQFGDWLSFRSSDLIDRSALTDIYLVAQAYFAHSTQLLINAATVLGKTEDIEKYSKLLQIVKEAFLKEYVTSNGRLTSNTQTAYVLALQFDLLPENIRGTAAKRLVENISSYNNHLTTGFLGTSYLPHVLSRFGYTDAAYKLLLQKTYPSWLYPVTRGATTIWERWDGIKPDSTFQTADMNSFNHYAYGAIGDWMYRVLAGIDMEESATAYKKIKIMPHPGGALNYVNASLQTYYGKISVQWKTNNGKFEMDVQIPANTTADIYIPIEDFKTYKKVSVGSGNYHF